MEEDILGVEELPQRWRRNGENSEKIDLGHQTWGIKP